MTHAEARRSRRQNWTYSIACCNASDILKHFLGGLPCQEAENKAMRSVTRMQATVWHRGRGFVGFQSIAHSPKSRADGQAFHSCHSFPHPGSCAGYACKALFWARFEHPFVQHRTISNYFEMLVRLCSILFRSIRHI